MPKAVVKKFNFGELKINSCSESNQIYISVFDVGGSSARCLTFRPFLTLDP